MKKVTLIFPDVTTMAEFILIQRLSHIETDCKHYKLTGLLSSENITLAKKKYKAQVVSFTSEIPQ